MSIALTPKTLTPEQQLTRAIVLAWRQVAHAKTATAAQHAAYTLLRGKSLDAAFTPLTTPGKIAQAQGNPFQARDAAIHAARTARLHALAPWQHLLEDVPQEPGRYAATDHPLLARLRAEEAA